MTTKPFYDFDRSKLAMCYDVEALQQETLRAIHGQPPYIHYSVLPLTMAGRRNPEVTDFSDPNWAEWLETRLLHDCPCIQGVLASLACQKTNVRLMRLESGAVVKEHCDPQLNLELRNQVRLHVPIFVDDAVEFRLNGKVVPLRPGELWYMRLSDPHSVHNHSNTERIQLSIDVVFNEWVEQMIVNGECS